MSSSGHLQLLKIYLKIETDTGLLFNTIIHLGNPYCNFIAFRQDVKKLLLEAVKAFYDIYGNVWTYFHNRHQQDAKRYKKIISNNYRKLLLLLFVSTVPTAFLGFFASECCRAGRKKNLLAGYGLFHNRNLLW